MIEAVHDFLAQSFVQTLIFELLILCVVLGIGTILILFVCDSIDLLRKILRRRK